MTSTARVCAFHLMKNSAKRNVQINQVRFRRIQSRNPPEPHFDRKAMVEACKPIIPRQERVCSAITYEFKPREPLPWNVVKARKLRQQLEDAKMILFVQRNPILLDKAFVAHNLLFKKDIFISFPFNEVIKLAIQDGFLANATPFTQSFNGIAVSPHADIKVALRLLKKIPQYILLAGVIDRTFLSRQQLEYIASVPSIQSLQSVTVGILATHQQQLSANLNQHQQRLSMLLSEHSKGAQASPTTALPESSESREHEKADGPS